MDSYSRENLFNALKSKPAEELADMLITNVEALEKANQRLDRMEIILQDNERMLDTLLKVIKYQNGLNDTKEEEK